MVVSFNKMFHLGGEDLRSGAKKDGEFYFRYDWLKCLWDVFVEILKRQVILKAAETGGVNDIARGECLEQ